MTNTDEGRWLEGLDEQSLRDTLDCRGAELEAAIAAGAWAILADSGDHADRPPSQEAYDTAMAESRLAVMAALHQLAPAHSADGITRLPAGALTATHATNDQWEWRDPTGLSEEAQWRAIRGPIAHSANGFTYIHSAATNVAPAVTHDHAIEIRRREGATAFATEPNATTAPTGTYRIDLPLGTVLAGWRDGDEHGWDTEFDLLWSTHQGHLDMLTTSIQESGIREPILLGTDGRVWDGHHRLCVASTLALHTVPVTFPAPTTPRGD